jgi:hypothetical protein
MNGEAESLSSDILLEVFSFVSGPDWLKLSLISVETARLAKTAPAFLLKSWNLARNPDIPTHLHEFLLKKRLLELFVILSHNPVPFFPAIDLSHRTLLDLSVDLRMYNFADWLVRRGFKSHIDAETMFNCIRNHDIRGASVLLSCGIPVDRFRSRDDGLNVLTCAVMYGSPALVDMFILRGCSYVI